MHTMQNTNRILSIIGSVFDFLGVLGLAASALMFKVLFTEEFFMEFVPEAETGEIQQIVELYQILGNVMIVLAMILGVIFIINLIVNFRLISGKLDENQARTSYTYQLFIGIVLVLLNTIAGICYIISGVQGRNNEPDKIETRTGI